MKVKGTAVKSIQQFVREKHPDQYDHWLKSLPVEAQRVMQDAIYATNWYSLHQAVVLPTEHIAHLFFNNDTKKGAWELGRYSAEIALSGVYKVFVKMSSPSFIINRATRIFSTYYHPATMIVPEKSDKSIVVHITEFETPHSTVENRIAGWVERALELSGCKEIKFTISKSLTLGDDLTEFLVSWK